MSNTFFRRWQILRQIPRYPNKIDVQEISRTLQIKGVEVHTRTIQRDLIELSQRFSILADERSIPYGWQWAKGAECFALPGLSMDEALAWVLVEQHLKQLLPSSTIDHLQPYFRSAHERLNSEHTSLPARSWLNKIKTVLPNQALVPPIINPQVQRAVSEALLHEKRLEIHYRKKGQKEATCYLLHPLALILRGSMLYLYARIFDYQDARNLALHRIEKVVVLDEPAVFPEGFDLNDKVAKGIWDFGAGDMTSIQLRFYDGAGEHLYETPLSTNQRIDKNNDSGSDITLHATVANTPQLLWWLLGFGGNVEVLAPSSLRQKMSQTAIKMTARYVSHETNTQKTQ